MKQTYFITNLQSLPHVTLSGSVSVPAPNKHFRRTPSDWILYFITNGSMLLQEEDTIYHLSAGQTLLLCPDKCHFGVQSNSPVSYYYIHFQWNPQKELLLSEEEVYHQFLSMHSELNASPLQYKPCEQILIPKNATLSGASYYEILNEIISATNNAVPGSPYHQSMINCNFAMLLLKICRAHINALFPPNNIGTFSALPLLSYLKSNYKTKITSVLLEKQFHHNFDYMNRKFKEVTGETIFAFLEKYRIEQAKILLSSKQFTVTQIAAQLGFCNGFYFSKVFKKNEGISPREYQSNLNNLQ